MKSNSTVSGGILRRDRSRAVGRTRVDTNEFEVCEGLSEHALNRLSEKAFHVAHNHRDGYRRITHTSFDRLNALHSSWAYLQVAPVAVSLSY